MAKVMTAHLQGTYVPLDALRPDLPRHLCQWVMWLMNRDARHRPQTALEALERLPLATSKDGGVYVVQAAEVEEKPLLSTTGHVHVVKPADLVADPGRPATRTPAAPPTQPSPPRTGGIPASPPSRGVSTATTGRVPTANTGQTRLNTGRVSSSPPPGTGAASIPATRADIPTQRRMPAWPLLFILPVLAGGVFAGVKFQLASEYPIRLQDEFAGREGILHASAPVKPPTLLKGRIWTATPGLKLTGKSLNAEAGRQLASFDLSQAFTSKDTVRIIISGLKNPNSGWFGFGLCRRPAPAITDDDLVAWVGITGDHNGNPGSGSIHEAGFRNKNVGFPKDYWKAEAGNDLELVINCAKGDAALFINGVRAAIGDLRTDGFTEPLSQLALVFQNIPGTTVEQVSFENLGTVDLLDIGPIKRASRDFLQNLPGASPTPAK